MQITMVRFIAKKIAIPARTLLSDATAYWLKIQKSVVRGSRVMAETVLKIRGKALTGRTSG